MSKRSFGGCVRFLAAAVAMVCLGSAASAAIIPLTPVVADAGGGNSSWTYDVNLTTGSQVQDGDFFVIYDFAGYVPGSVSAPAGWTAVAALLTPPPPGVALLDVDSALDSNLVFTRTGGTIVNGDELTSVDLGSFSALSIFSEVTTDLSAYQNHDNSNPAGLPATGQNIVEVPLVPEPASLGLLAMATVGGLLRRRR